MQWLDQRLEKVLLARRRGGLAARGRRTLPMQVGLEWSWCTLVVAEEQEALVRKDI